MVRFTCPCGAYFSYKTNAIHHINAKNKCKAWSVHVNLTIEHFTRQSAREQRQQQQESIAMDVISESELTEEATIPIIPNGSQQEFRYVIDHSDELVPMILHTIDEDIGGAFCRAVWFNPRHPKLHNVWMISERSEAIRVIKNVFEFTQIVDMDLPEGIEYMFMSAIKLLNAVCDYLDPVHHIVVKFYWGAADKASDITQDYYKGRQLIRRRLKCRLSFKRLPLSGRLDDIRRFTRPALEYIDIRDDTTLETLMTRSQGYYMCAKNDPYKAAKNKRLPSYS